MKTLCIIPARSGSKRIKNKNIKFFCGKPIIYWVIQAAKESKCFDKILVSSDSNKILNLAKKFGSNILKRSKRLSNDYSTVHDVIQNVVGELKKKGEIFDFICYILPTAALIRSEDIIKSYSIIKKNNSNFVITVCGYSFPPQKALKINKSGKIVMKNLKNYKKRSQDLSQEYHDAAQVYWGTTDLILSSKNTVKNNSYPYIVPQLRVQDIDTLEDWHLAEFKFRYLKKIK